MNESRKAGGETLAKGWSLAWGTERRSGSSWEHHSGNVERKMLESIRPGTATKQGTSALKAGSNYRQEG